ncbi:NADH-quinone oxidoreductase subunit G [Singulisphaera sp. GP187]|uniref:molybdopterin-dependent oxidoreductase n=1 Tax=Singulisphaera sp. GP187 TaxID=1882752 RepID=UPI000926657E|nr:molybdopterin-dependent oxidoreductase [Singulisphaera sp. GP187]SIO62152.1 NADH-quinone oxidoreductase subunit G [Singulisphaera sp. GP187]
MATIFINGQEHEIPEGEKLNAIQMASRVGVDIPYYCWHPALSVVANCRMCEIEVGNKDPKTGEIKMIPKLVPACQTPAKDTTVLVTDSPKVKEHQRMIMEYLLINHPLDCPVCDQAGECGLQDYSYEYGQSNHRFVEERTVNPRKEVSDLIQLNQDRCIMCTRCVRFTREITQTGELQVMRRGNHAEIGVFPEYPLDNPLAGNVVDICPVGALLDKDFLHKQRVWFLAKHDSICTRCSTGCNVSAEENRGQLWRYKPRFNPDVNDYWICDEGRYSYKEANDPALLSAMYVRQQGDLKPATIDQALKNAGQGLVRITESGGLVAGILSPFLTVEEAYLLATYLKGLNSANVLALGPVPRSGVDRTFEPDQQKGRTGDTSFVIPRPFTIHSEKCPNRRGVEAILEHFQGEVIDFASISGRAANGEFRGLFVVSDAIDPAFTEDDVRKLRPKVEFLVVQDTHVTELAQAADVVLAGATFAEKAGSYVNADGRLQYAEASLPPRDGSLPDLDVLAILIGRSTGPVDSRGILAELAGIVPAFAVAEGGRVAPFGVVLESTAPVGAGVPFRDPWMQRRGLNGDRPNEPSLNGGKDA